MRKRISIILVITLIVLAVKVNGQDYRLCYKQPAENWNEALPVGNERLGAMVFGGVESERLQLNEETVWTKGGRLLVPLIFRVRARGRWLLHTEISC